MRVLLTLALVLFIAAPPAAQAKRAWEDLYREAIDLIAKQQWKKAEDTLQAAIKSGPPSGRGVIRRTFGRDDDYFPEYYLGIVYLNTGRAPEAQIQFQVARKRGINLREKEFQQLPSLEERAATIVDAEAKKRAANAPGLRFKDLMGQAQRALADSRFEDAETAARQARGLNVDNAAADQLLQNITRTRANQRLQAQLKGSPSVAELRRMLTEFEGTGVSLDEVRKRIDAGEAIERRNGQERTAMIAFFAGQYTQAVAALAEAEKAAALSPRGHFYRALTLASLATRGKVTNQNQLREARKAWTIANERADTFKADLRYISPQILQLLRGS